jgi:hypothetical protein
MTAGNPGPYGRSRDQTLNLLITPHLNSYTPTTKPTLYTLYRHPNFLMNSSKIKHNTTRVVLLRVPYFLADQTHPNSLKLLLGYTYQ